MTDHDFERASLRDGETRDDDGSHTDYVLEATDDDGPSEDAIRSTLEDIDDRGVDAVCPIDGCDGFVRVLTSGTRIGCEEGHIVEIPDSLVTDGGVDRTKIGCDECGNAFWVETDVFEATFGRGMASELMCPYCRRDGNKTILDEKIETDGGRNVTEYRYESDQWDREDETVEIPDEATGLTVTYFGPIADAKYLIPADGGRQ